MSESLHGMWSSRLMFILAAAGSAVGLGNIWRFPYIAGENGGGAFVLVYLVCILLIGVPIMVSETLLGRAGRMSPINTMRDLARRSGAFAGWQMIGWMGVITGVLILSFYGVIAGWAMYYLVEMASGTFVGASAEFTGDKFGDFTGSAGAVVGWQTLFMLLTALIAALGVRRGLETTVKYLMPSLYLLLAMLVFWAATESGHFLEGVLFMFAFKADQFTIDAVLAAMGHAFFTLSLGMGAIMAYGAYLPKDTSIFGAATTIAIMDTVVALLAALVIFPIVFANDLESSAGPGLMFVTLPIAFGQMPGGQFFGTLFFLLVTFAAITSAISLIEPILAWMVEKFKASRPACAMIVGAVIWLFGLGSAFSFNLWQDIHLFPGMTFFDVVDFASDKILLPLGGILIALFAGWVLERRILADELGLSDRRLNQTWLLLTQYVAPTAVAIVFVVKLLDLVGG